MLNRKKYNPPLYVNIRYEYFVYEAIGMKRGHLFFNQDTPKRYYP